MRFSRMARRTAVLTTAAGLAVLTPPAVAAEPRPVCTVGDPGGDCQLRVAAPATTGAAAPAEMPLGALTAADLQDAYNLPSDLLGSGSIVAVVVPYGHGNAAADLNAYRTANGLHPCDEEFPCLRTVNQRGEPTPPPDHPGYSLSATAGLQMASAACPNCRLLLVESDDESLANQGIAVDQAVAQGADAVVLMAAGFDEYDGQAAHAPHFDHPGVAIVAPASTTGFNGTGRQVVPAAYPSVLAVGGTELYRDPATERGWSERVFRNTGSGCSVHAARPSWQQRGDCGDRRTVADVAAVASDLTPVATYDSNWGGWTYTSGTPIAAAVIAGVAGLAGSTSTAPAPERLYKNRRHLFDITAGRNGSCVSTYLCAAGRGYDGPSGLGTPNGIGAF